MFRYTKAQVIEIAKTNNFITNTTEKILRLYDILEYFNKCEYNNALVLKGGTAINLCLLNLPRLSVDIDFDFSIACNKEEMLEYRKRIKKLITKYMADEKYELSDRSKFAYSLDSFVYGYNTLAGSKDVLKIEINYSNRYHILKPIVSPSTNVLGRVVDIRRLSNNELIGSKINALITRTTVRDVYDVYNLIKSGLIEEIEYIKKIAIFYVVLASHKPIDFDSILNECYKRIDSLNHNKVKASLLPVLHKHEKIEIRTIASEVSLFLRKTFILTLSKKEYIQKYNLNEYQPSLLFDGLEISDISNHPMILWKMNN